MSMLGSGELFAVSQGARCEGNEKCHWCKAPCGRNFPHDDPPPIPFVRSREGAKNPGGLYVCEGCRLYRRPSCTVWWLTDGFKDRQSLRKLSWWLTADGARGIRREEDRETLWNVLLAPPPLFCLSLLENPKLENHLHHAVVNDHDVVQADTTLYFTVDNVKFDFSVYELKEACKHGPEGKSPGVQALIGYLGEYRLPDEKHVEHRRGRPPKHEDDNIRRVVSKK